MPEEMKIEYGKVVRNIAFLRKIIKKTYFLHIKKSKIDYKRHK